MNNEQQTWILRKPIIGKKYVNGKANFPEGVWSRFIETKSGMATMSEEVFHETFVELDVAGLTRQVEESLTFLCQYAYDAGYTTGNDRTVTGKDVDLSIKTTALKIVGLLLNQEKETK